MEVPGSNNVEWRRFATGKTLEETSQAFDRMQYIAGRIYKALTREGTPSLNKKKT